MRFYGYDEHYRAKGSPAARAERREALWTVVGVVIAIAALWAIG